MKKYIYILGAALVSSLILTSCKDFLEAENKSAGGQTAEQFFNGGGHLNASGGRVYGNIDDAVEVVKQALQTFEEELK